MMGERFIIPRSIAGLIFQTSSGLNLKTLKVLNF